MPKPGLGDAPPSLKRICVFCGSSVGSRPAYAAAARQLADAMVSREIGLVYGGGTVGLMGEIARTVAGGLGPGHVLGVIPAALAPREISDELIGDTRVVGDMHERKAMMARAADGFIAMPGGLGTLEELLEVMTWQQLGFHAKPVALLNTEGYYDGLIAFFRHCVNEGFVKGEHFRLLVAEDPQQLVADMAAWQPPASNVIADAQARAAAVGVDIAGPSSDAV
ncbi:LOG7 [Scenedesmus sp. PABB004]|nr:LOG7 [Scenedesmus sp. PABB004]